MSNYEIKQCTVEHLGATLRSMRRRFRGSRGMIRGMRRTRPYI